MSKHSIVLLIGLIVCSCSPRICPSVVDSVRVEIRERIQIDTVTIEIPQIKEVVVTRDSSSHLENDYAISDASIVDGLLHHSLETTGKQIIVPVEVIVHDTLMVEKSAETIVKEVEVEKELTWWQQTKMKLFWVFLVIISVFVGIKWLNSRIKL